MSGARPEKFPGSIDGLPQAVERVEAFGLRENARVRDRIGGPGQQIPERKRYPEGAGQNGQAQSERAAYDLKDAPERRWDTVHGRLSSVQDSAGAGEVEMVQVEMVQLPIRSSSPTMPRSGECLAKEGVVAGLPDTAAGVRWDLSDLLPHRTIRRLRHSLRRPRNAPSRLPARIGGRSAARGPHAGNCAAGAPRP